MRKSRMASSNLPIGEASSPSPYFSCFVRTPCHASPYSRVTSLVRTNLPARCKSKRDNASAARITGRSEGELRCCQFVEEILFKLRPAKQKHRFAPCIARNRRRARQRLATPLPARCLGRTDQDPSCAGTRHAVSCKQFFQPI